MGADTVSGGAFVTVEFDVVFAACGVGAACGACTVTLVQELRAKDTATSKKLKHFINMINKTYSNNIIDLLVLNRHNYLFNSCFCSSYG